MRQTARQAGCLPSVPCQSDTSLSHLDLNWTKFSSGQSTVDSQSLHCTGIAFYCHWYYITFSHYSITLIVDITLKALTFWNSPQCSMSVDNFRFTQLGGRHLSFKAAGDLLSRSKSKTVQIPGYKTGSESWHVVDIGLMAKKKSIQKSKLRLFVMDDKMCSLQEGLGEV